MKKHRLSLLPVAALAALIPLSLTGCSLVNDLVYQQATSSFESAADAPASSPAHADWVPSDASDIHVVESTRAGTQSATASILLTSALDLDPAVCALVERQSAPQYIIDGAPAAYEADEVYACGIWSVIPSDDGWLGWTPNHPDEQAQSPAAG